MSLLAGLSDLLEPWPALGQKLPRLPVLLQPALIVWFRALTAAYGIVRHETAKVRVVVLSAILTRRGEPRNVHCSDHI